jgi:hypothetical protein
MTLLVHHAVSIAFVSVALLATSATGSAQQAGHAFETFRVDLSATANVNNNTLHEFWDPRVGAELSVATPFYLGSVELGAHYVGFNALASEQPDFTSLYIYLGWGYELALSQRLRWYNGFRIGSFLMRFDVPSGNKTEQELALALNTGLRYPIAGRWSMALSARYQVTYTHERMRLLYISAGLGRSFGMPGWLKEFLD